MDHRAMSLVGVVLLVAGGLLMSSVVLPVQGGTEGTWKYTRGETVPISSTTTTSSNSTTTTASSSTTSSGTSTTTGESQEFELSYSLQVIFKKNGEVVYTQPFSLYSDLDDASFDEMELEVSWTATGTGLQWSTFDLDIYVRIVITDEFAGDIVYPIMALEDQAYEGSTTVNLGAEDFEGMLDIMGDDVVVQMTLEVEFDFSVFDNYGDVLSDSRVASLDFSLSTSPIGAYSVVAVPGLFGMSSTTGGLNPLTNMALWPILIGLGLFVYEFVLPALPGGKR